MKNSTIFLLASLATFGVCATGSEPLSVKISPEMMAAARNANAQAVQTLNDDEQGVARQFASSIAEFSKSDAFKKKQEAVKSQVFASAGMQDDEKKEDGPKLAGNQLVMFVSSSMPLVTLRKYAHDLSKVGGVMVMRGTVGGISKMVDTITLTRNVLNADPSCEGANARCGVRKCSSTPCCSAFTASIKYQLLSTSLTCRFRVTAMAWKRSIRHQLSCMVMRPFAHCWSE